MIGPQVSGQPRRLPLLSWISLFFLFISIVSFVLRSWEFALGALAFHWATGALVMIRRSKKS